MHEWLKSGYCSSIYRESLNFRTFLLLGLFENITPPWRRVLPESSQQYECSSLNEDAIVNHHSDCYQITSYRNVSKLSDGHVLATSVDQIRLPLKTYCARFFLNPGFKF